MTPSCLLPLCNCFKCGQTLPARTADECVGHVVREMRHQRGLKQSELAAKLGMTASHLSRFERGKVTVPLRMLPALAGALRIPIRDLIPAWYLERG